MNTLRVVGRSSLVVLLATVVVTAQAQSQAPEQNPIKLPAQYDAALAPDATDWSKDVPAHIAIVDGAATIEREGRVEKAEEDIVLLAGDRLRTQIGRVEILFSDGSALDLDHNTRVDLMSDSLIRLLEGRVRLSIVSTTSVLDYRVDAAPGSVAIKAAGDYRIALSVPQGGDQELDLAVFRGSAELSNPLGLTLVRAGTHAAVTARTAPSLPYVVNSAAWDEFDRWVETQRDARYGVESAKYLPEEVRSYGGAFDQYGTWGYQPSYGYVWYPTVPVGWYPYSYGRWSFAGRFGWYWAGFNHGWGWPTHHFGRWGFTGSNWYWIPGNHWGPAWVSWAYAPGYVGWCPLGFDNRAVIGFTHVNVRPFGPWSAWTVVPSRSFGPKFPVPRHLIAVNSLAPTTFAQFRQRETAPAAPAVAVPRAQPLSAPTAAYAVARGTNPGSAIGSPAGAIAPPASRAPSRIPSSRSDAGRVGDARLNSTVPSPSAAPQRPISPENSTASRFKRLDPGERQAVPPNYSSQVRNYSPSPPANADRESGSRVPDAARVDPAQPTGDRAQPRGQYSWPRRNDLPEPVNLSPEPRGFSRIPRPASPEPRPAAPAPDPGAGDRSGFRSRGPEMPRPAAPAPSVPGGTSRAEPRSSAPPPPNAPERSAPPARTAPPDGGGRGQAGPRRGGG